MASDEGRVGGALATLGVVWNGFHHVGDQVLPLWQPVIATTEPGESYVAYDVTLLDLPGLKGALAPIQECASIILTPTRLAELRRRHALALASAPTEQAWSELVADIVGRPAAASAKGEPPTAGGPPAATGGRGGPGARTGRPEGVVPQAGGPGPRGAELLNLPQTRLLWELVKQAAAPR